VVLALFAWGFATLTDNDGETVASPRLGTGLTGLSIATSTKVRMSPDSTRVLVVEAGQVVVVGIDDAEIVARAGRNIVDAAWMPDGERVLVVEGPIPTGQILTLDMNGEVDGVAQLAPSISFGDGNGIAVDSRGTKAAVIATTREAVGGRVHSDLATVELQTGKVRVYSTPDRNEFNPLFVDDDFVAVASEGERGAARLAFVDLGTAGVTAGRPIIGGPFVRTVGGEVVVARRASHGATRLLAVDAQTGDEREVHVTKPHRRVVAVDRQVTRCLVRVVDPGGTAHLDLEPFA
jgi:hypothetical protein